METYHSYWIMCLKKSRKNTEPFTLDQSWIPSPTISLTAPHWKTNITVSAQMSVYLLLIPSCCWVWKWLLVYTNQLDATHFALQQYIKQYTIRVIHTCQALAVPLQRVKLFSFLFPSQTSFCYEKDCDLGKETSKHSWKCFFLHLSGVSIITVLPPALFWNFQCIITW